MLKKIFTSIIILSPVLAIYHSYILSLTLADIAILCIIPFLIKDILVKGKIKKPFIFQFLFIAIYMIFQLIFLSIFSSPDYLQKILLPTLRILFYYIIIAIFLKNYFDIKFGLKTYEKVVLFSSIFLIIQFIILQLTGKYIPGYINIPGTWISDSLRIHAATINAFGRVRSIFGEPSHYAIYCALYLAINLIFIDKKITIKNIIITLAMLLSASSTAVILIIVIYLLYFVFNFKMLFEKYSMRFIFSILLIGIFVIIYMQTNSFDVFVQRTFIDSNAVDGRFGNYDLMFNENNKTLLSSIFGNGILKIEDYIPSFPRIYLYFGYIGLIYFIIISFKNLTMLKKINRIAYILVIILIFPTEFIFGINVLLYAPFVYLNFDEVLNE